MSDSEESPWEHWAYRWHKCQAEAQRGDLSQIWSFVIFVSKWGRKSAIGRGPGCGGTKQEKAG